MADDKGKTGNGTNNANGNGSGKAYTADQLKRILLDKRNRRAMLSALNDFLDVTQTVTPSGVGQTMSVHPVIYAEVAGLDHVPTPGYMNFRQVFDDDSYPDEYKRAAVEFALDTVHHPKFTTSRAASYLSVDRDMLGRWVHDYRNANPAFKKASSSHMSKGYTIGDKQQAIDYVKSHLHDRLSDIARALKVPDMTLTGWLASAYQSTVADYENNVSDLTKSCDALRDQLRAAGIKPVC